MLMSLDSSHLTVRQCNFEVDEPMVNAKPLSYLTTKRAKLLVHGWSSGCLATACAIEKLFLKRFPLTMATRFEIVDAEYIEELLNKNHSTERTFSKSL